MTERIPIIRTSERVLFKRCQRAWWWAYREGLKPRGRGSDALYFGGLVHEALAAWYCGPGSKRGVEPAETFAALATDTLRQMKVADATEEEVAQWVDAQTLGVTMLEEYRRLWGRDEKILMIAPEQTFTFDVPFPEWWSEPTRSLLARYNGTFDGVYRNAETGLLWLIEHKTAKTVRIDHLPLDEQAGSYWAVATPALRKAGLIKPTETLKGIMYNFLRKSLPDPRPVDAEGYFCNKPAKADYINAILGLDPHDGRTPTELGKMKVDALATEAAVRGLTVLGERSKLQPKPLFERHPIVRTSGERKSQLLRIQTDAAQMELYRTKELPITKTPHHSCKWCDFYHMCRLEEASGNWKDFRTVAFKTEDPYADHRKSAEEMGTFEL